MGADDKKIIDEEAAAEEEFIADLEDTIENPLVYDGDKLTVQDKKEELQETEKKEELAGAIGTGGLTPEAEPFNNEQALRSESVNNDENPFGADVDSGKAFGGPDSAPLSDATETVAPNPDVASSFGEAGGDASGATDFSAGGEPAENSEPTIEQLANDTPAANPADAAPVAAPAPAATTAAPGAEPAKKKKKGLVVGIIVGVLLLAAIVGGVIFYILHESKERMLSDAVYGLWTAEARQFDGKFTITPEDDGDITYKSVTIDFKGDSNAANFSGSGTLSVEFKEGNPLTLTLGGAYLSSDGIYIMVDNLGETLKSVDLGAVMGADGDGQEAEYVDVMKDTLSAVGKAIDGKWYKITADTFGSDEKSKESYECLTKAIDEISGKEVKSKLADIYTAHPFIVFDEKDSEKADGLTYYYVKSDDKEAEAFVKDAGELNALKDMKACASSSTSSSGLSIGGDSDDTDDTDEKKEEESAVTEMKIGIKGWSHELKAIKGTTTSKKTKVDMDVKIGYEKKEVSAPSADAKDISEAIKDALTGAKDAYKSGMMKIFDKQCKESAGGNDSLYKYCRESVEKELDEQFEQMMGNYTGGTVINTSAILGEEADEVEDVDDTDDTDDFDEIEDEE